MEELGFEKIFTSEEGSGYVNREAKAIALVAEADYISIKKFKQLFEMLADEIESEQDTYEKFIFDKSALRTFHQPSMKWYFTEWKTAMLPYGLKKHYKILPALDYFKKAVEAARKPLLKQYPKEVFEQLTISYFDSVKEALDSE